jgi:hypothetical protein
MCSPVTKYDMSKKVQFSRKDQPVAYAIEPPGPFIFHNFILTSKLSIYKCIGYQIPGIINILASYCKGREISEIFLVLSTYDKTVDY